jgi:polysaccharide export outer membrane protein
MKYVITAAVVLVLLCPHPSPAQTQTRDPGVTSNYTPASTWKKRDYQVGFWRLAKLSKDYELGPGDEIQIGIYGVADLSGMLQSMKITNAGDVQIPLLGTMRAAGLSAEALEEQVAAALKERGLIDRPEVLITVLEYQSKPVYVIGEVDNPGEYVMSQPWTLTEAILIAGGLDFGAARYGYLHRRRSADTPVAPPPGKVEAPETPMPGRDVIKIDLQPLKTGKVLDPDPVLQTGDVLIVPSRKVELAFVIGAVMNPGGVVLPPEGQAPVSRALSAVGGPTKTAKMSEGIIVRTGPDGVQQQMKIDYAAILSGRQPDVTLQANDVVFVPGSGAKTFGMGLLNMIPSFVQTAAVIALVP